MPLSNEDVMKELQRLRTEIQQLREVVSALFNAVFEDNEEEWDSVPEKDEFNLYN
jgi:predicted AAA+ superfamily ATPase